MTVRFIEGVLVLVLSASGHTKVRRGVLHFYDTLTSGRKTRLRVLAGETGQGTEILFAFQVVISLGIR